MKRILLALSALAIGTMAASAADLPARTYTKAPPAPLPPPCIWCGFYIGLNGGWAGTSGSNDLSAQGFDGVVASPAAAPVVPIGPPVTSLSSQNINGGFGGGQIGYNWVFPGGTYGAGSGWLVGVEGDIQGASLHGSRTLSFFSEGGDDFHSASTDSRLNWFGTLRGRFGFATGPVLFYGTGGFAFGGVKNNLLVSFSDNNTALADCTVLPCSASTLVHSDSTRTGWVAGAGIEWMFAPNWSLKGEYQYIDLGTVTQAASAFADPTVDGPEGTIGIRRVHETFNTVRIGVNYHFGGPALGGY